MNLMEQAPTEELPIARLVGGRLEMGIHPVLFGFRIRVLSLTERDVDRHVAIDYCAGGRPHDVLMVYLAVYFILRNQNYKLTAEEFGAMAPRWQVRPILKDPCWQKLLDWSFEYPAGPTRQEEASRVAQRILKETAQYRLFMEPEIAKNFRHTAY